MTDYKSRDAGSRRKKGRGRQKNPPTHFTHPRPPLSSGRLLAWRKHRGRKGSDGCLLFKLCVPRFQAQHTLIQIWLFISTQYPCRQRQAAAVFIIEYITETLNRRVCLLRRCPISDSFYRISPFINGESLCLQSGKLFFVLKAYANKEI